MSCSIIRFIPYTGRSDNASAQFDWWTDIHAAIRAEAEHPATEGADHKRSHAQVALATPPVVRRGINN